MTFETRESLPMLTLWKSFIIPCVEYCSQLWSPTKKGLIQDLEILQKNFLRKLTGFNKLNYWELLETLQLFSLERRRERYTVIYVWKVLKGLVLNFSHIENGESVGGICSYNQNRLGRKCVILVIER